MDSLCNRPTRTQQQAFFKGLVASNGVVVYLTVGRGMILPDGQKSDAPSSDEYKQIWMKVAGTKEGLLVQDPWLDKLKYIEVGLFDINGTVQGIS